VFFRIPVARLEGAIPLILITPQLGNVPLRSPPHDPEGVAVTIQVDPSVQITPLTVTDPLVPAVAIVPQVEALQPESLPLVAFHCKAAELLHEPLGSELT
jgi:hypothetical protein